MANVISDETIEYVGILAKLALSDAEKEQAKKDMGNMLDYIDKLNELDTTGIEPMSHVFPVQNVFREDIVTNKDESEKTLRNAPGQKDNMFMVPRTLEKSEKSSSRGFALGAQSQELLSYALAKSSSKGFAPRGTKPRTAKLCAGKK